jgi:hypothetical protein
MQDIVVVENNPAVARAAEIYFGLACTPDSTTLRNNSKPCGDGLRAQNDGDEGDDDGRGRDGDSAVAIVPDTFESHSVRATPTGCAFGVLLL